MPKRVKNNRIWIKVLPDSGRIFSSILAHIHWIKTIYIYYIMDFSFKTLWNNWTPSNPICSMVLEYLSTFAQKSPCFVGKYTSTMVRINGNGIAEFIQPTHHSWQPPGFDRSMPGDVALRFHWPCGVLPAAGRRRQGGSGRSWEL